MLVYEWDRRDLLVLFLLSYGAMYPPMLLAGVSFTRYAEVAGLASLLTLVPALQFPFSSGNIATGVIRVYGLAK